MPGDQKLECELTIKAGQVVWDLNGLSRPMWNERSSGEQSGVRHAES